MWKKFLCALLVITMLFSMTGCSELFGCVFFLSLIASGDDRAEQTDIFQFVRKNENTLLQAIESGDFSAFEKYPMIKQITPYETYVEFGCGGYGIGSATSYVGFYYTAENDMCAIAYSPSSASELKPCGNGYEWKEPNGDNRYYTEHICGNFYYYELSF